MATEQHIHQGVGPIDTILPGSHPADGHHGRRRRPAIVLVKSVALAALAGIGILVVLPAALAAQAAAL